MAKIPEFFRTAGDPVLASYEWKELLTGYGYIDFYPMSTETYTDGVGTSYTKILSTETRKSEQEEVLVQNSTGTTITPADWDSSPLTFPMNIKGKIFIVFANNTARGYAGTTATWASVGIYYVRNGTETLIGTTDAGYIGSSASGTTYGGVHSTIIDITTQVNLQIGDVIRFKVTGHVRLIDGGLRDTLSVYTNPLNTLTGLAPAGSSQLKISIPQRVIQ
jgi:hypothetical protein